jgi:hypothetical protein
MGSAGRRVRDTHRPVADAWWFAPAHVGATALTAVNGLVVGYGAVAFQLFGASPDSDDYMVALGGYAAAAVLLGLSAVTAFVLGRMRALGWVSVVIASLLGLAAVGSATDAAATTERGPGINGVWDGVGGVVALPWSWAIVVLLVLALRARRVTART